MKWLEINELRTYTLSTPFVSVFVEYSYLKYKSGLNVDQKHIKTECWFPGIEVRFYFIYISDKKQLPIVKGA